MKSLKGRDILVHQFTYSDTSQIVHIIHSHIFSWYSFGSKNYIISTGGAAIAVKESLEEIKEKWLKAEKERTNSNVSKQSKKERQGCLCSRNFARKEKQKR